MSLLRWLFFIALILLIPAWWVFFRIGIDSDTPRTYRFLITKESSSRLFTSTEQKVISSWLLFYRYPKGDFFLFEIDDATQIKVSEGFYVSINRDRTFLKEQLAQYYGVRDFDFEIRFTEKKMMDFLYQQGGSSFFNLYSSALPLGEVYINSINYTNFLAKIENPYLQKITALGFWFNLFMSFQETLPHRVYTDEFLTAIYEVFSSNFNYPTFRALTDPLLFSGRNRNPTLIRDRITFEFDKNSIESISNTETQIFIPYQDGEYDREKLTSQWYRLETGDNSPEERSITAQIRNATTVKRLAARAAGFFRLKGINIMEYLGFSTLLKHSVILDFSNQPLKRAYIKKVTKIDRVYHLFNYRENYDFGIYLGEDLYIFQNSDVSK